MDRRQIFATRDNRFTQRRAPGRTPLWTCLAVLASLASPPLWAAPADLDTSFNGGLVTISMGPDQDQATAVAIQPDGRVVAGGWSATRSTTAELANWAVARRNSDGSLDTTFGSGSGQLVTPVGDIVDGGASSLVTALVVPSDGRILAAGKGVSGDSNDLYLLRWNADGSPDTSYGSGGVAHLHLASGSVGLADHGLALQSDGKALVSGSSSQGPVIARFTTAGQLDPTFGSGGVFTYGTADNLGDVGPVTIQPDGKILFEVDIEVSGSGSGIVRLTRNGALDTSFGDAGLAAISRAFGGTSGVVVQPDGAILAAAWTSNYSTWMFRLDSHGKPDHSFNADGNADGKVKVPMGVTQIALLPTGQILLTGINLHEGPDFKKTVRIGRINADGSLDTSFTSSAGGSGIIDVAGAGGSAVESQDVQLLSDGRFVVTGGNGNDFFLARFQGDALRLKPKPFTFTSVTGVPESTVQVSNVVKIAGLTAGAKVPVTVAGGSYSINGDPFVSTLGYVGNGDQVMVEQTSAAASHTSVTTTLKVGGINTAATPWVVNGYRVVTTFTSTTL